MPDRVNNEGPPKAGYNSIGDYCVYHHQLDCRGNPLDCDLTPAWVRTQEWFNEHVKRRAVRS